MEWAKIHSKIWTDSWFRRLPRNDRDLFIHLISNIQMNLTKIYEYPIDLMANLAQMTVEETEQSLQNLQRDKRVAYVDGYVIVVNGFKYQDYNANTKIACQREICKLPDKVAAHPLATNCINYYMQDNHDYKRPIYEELDTQIEIETIQDKITKTVNKPLRQAKEKCDYDALLAHWNSKGMKNGTRHPEWHYHDKIMEGWKAAIDKIFDTYKLPLMLKAIDNYANECLTPGMFRNQHPENWWTIFIFFKQSNGFLAFVDKKTNVPATNPNGSYRDKNKERTGRY